MNEKLHKAMLLAAQSQTSLSDFWDAHAPVDRPAGRSREDPNVIEVSDVHGATVRVRLDEALIAAGLMPAAETEERERREAEHEMLMSRLASDPELRAHMQCWTIDFHGDEEPPGTVNGNIESMTPEQTAAATFADFGVLPRLVRQWAEEHGFHISGSESGAHGWLLGIPCTEAEADRLCRMAYDELGTHIRAGTLTLQIHFCGWTFKSMPTTEDAREFLRTQSIS
jgi:hypothetical protein